MLLSAVEELLEHQRSCFEVAPTMDPRISRRPSRSLQRAVDASACHVHEAELDLNADRGGSTRRAGCTREMVDAATWSAGASDQSALPRRSAWLIWFS